MSWVSVLSTSYPGASEGQGKYAQPELASSDDIVLGTVTLVMSKGFWNGVLRKSRRHNLNSHQDLYPTSKAPAPVLYTRITALDCQFMNNNSGGSDTHILSVVLGLATGHRSIVGCENWIDQSSYIKGIIRRWHRCLRVLI